MKIITKIMVIFLISCMMWISGCAKKNEVNTAWYDYRMIAHAGGGIDGKTMTNSLEALNLAKKNGYKLVEIDFGLTSDDVLVLKHDFSKESLRILEQPVIGEDTIQIWDREMFINTKIYRKYTPMEISDLVQWMEDNPDIFIITDTKETSEELVTKEFEQLVIACNNDESILDRFVVQIYNNDMYDTIKKIYDFPNVLYTIYQIAEPSEDFFHSLSDFCIKNGIEVVTIPKDYLWQPFIDILKQNGLIIYTHTLNTISDLERAINMGVHGVYTDFLYESDIDYIVIEN